MSGQEVCCLCIACSSYLWRMHTLLDPAGPAGYYYETLS